MIHPIWSIYPLVEADVQFDFGAVYGQQWAGLTAARPVSVVLAAGSEVVVFPRQKSPQVRWPVRRGADLGKPTPI